MKNIAEIERKIISAQKELAELNARRSALLERIKQLKEEREAPFRNMQGNFIAFMT